MKGPLDWTLQRSRVSTGALVIELPGRQDIQKHGPESWEAITRLASFTDAETLTNRQLKLSGSGMHSIHASSFNHSSVRDVGTPGPIKLVMESMKAFSSRSGAETVSWPIAGAFSIDS
jgi:hypothetical protein